MNRQGFLETVTNGSMTYPIARNTLTIWELIIQTYAISISSQTGFGRDSSLNSPKNNKNLAPTKQTGPTKQQNVHPKDAFFCFFYSESDVFFVQTRCPCRCIQLLANNWHSNFGCRHVARLHFFFDCWCL